MTTTKAPANEKDPGALGTDLAATIKTGGGKPDKTVAAAIAKLRKGESLPTNKQLISLRDFVNSVAAENREEGGDGAVASRLSSLNRAVRRLERSTRS